jgi:hypothetical protein
MKFSNILINKKQFLCNNIVLLYSYKFNPIKSTHLRHVTVHYLRIIIECSTIYTSSRKQTTKINKLLPLHNVQCEKNTESSGRPIRKNTLYAGVLFVYTRSSR